MYHSSTVVATHGRSVTGLDLEQYVGSKNTCKSSVVSRQTFW